MNKYAIVFILFANIQITQAADRDDNNLSQLPTDLKKVLVQLLQRDLTTDHWSGNQFTQSIENIKNLSLVDKTWNQFLNNPETIDSLLTELSTLWNLPKSAIAFSLGNQAAHGWLTKRNLSLVKILDELIEDKNLSSSSIFFNSPEFLKLAQKLNARDVIIDSINQLINSGLNFRDIGTIRNNPLLYKLVKRIFILLAVDSQIKRLQNPLGETFLGDILARESADNLLPYENYLLNEMAVNGPILTGLIDSMKKTKFGDSLKVIGVLV